MRILIITGGRINRDFALAYLKKEYFDHVIVVDGALEFWQSIEQESGVMSKIDYLVGDFDTVSPSVFNQYVNRNDIDIRRFIPEKDYTDTEIAVHIASELLLRYDANGEITFLGATGSRIDHSLANLQMLEQLYIHGLQGVIINETNRIRLVSNSITIHSDDVFGKYVSLIPITETLEGVTLKGFKYPLKNATVYRGQSLCVSNEIISERAIVEINNGKAWLIESKDD